MVAKRMKKIAPLFIVAAGTMWGCMGLLVRMLDQYGLDSMGIVGLRCQVTFFCVALLLMIFKRNAFRIRLKDIWCFLGTGIVSVAFFSFCYFKTITLASLSVAAILLYTAPVFVTLMAAFLFKEKLTGRKVLALLLAFFGCILVTGIAGQELAISPLGILTGLGAGFGYALYSIFSRYALERGYSSATITLYTFLFSGIAGIPFISGRKLSDCFSGNIELTLMTFFLIILTTVAPYFVYTLGLSYMEAGKASVIASIEPVVAILLGAVIYNEGISAVGALGIGMVLAAIAMIH